MKIPKVKADFRRMKILELLLLAKNVLVASRSHPALQGGRPEFLPSDEALSQSIDNLNASYTAALSGDRDKKKIRERDQNILIGQLNIFAHYYETAAAQNHDFILNTGFAEAPAIKNTHKGFLQAPTPPQLKHGPYPGSIIAKTGRVQYARSYEMHLTEADPTIEGNWRFQGMHYKSSEMPITGLEGGRVYSFRVRAVGPDDKGPWSPPSTLRSM
jgi:hypothetical protein